MAISVIAFAGPKQSQSRLRLQIVKQMQQCYVRPSVATMQLRCTRGIQMYSTRASKPRPYQSKPARDIAPKPRIAPQPEDEKVHIASAGSNTLNRPHPLPMKKRKFSKIGLVFGVVIFGTIIYSMVLDPLRMEGPTIAEKDALSKQAGGVTNSSPMRLRMENLIKSEQAAIVKELEKLDKSKRFRVDQWTRPNGGGGISCVLQDGDVFEKAGVNTSVVYGTLPRPAIQKMRVNHKALDPDVEALEFFAAGLSCVLHPSNPNAPTVHFNYRYFETMDADGECNAWWFGGGTDLTPSYLFDEDAIHFHRTIKDTCDKHDKAFFPRFKAWCDKYFFIPHRGESRGIGGIFFDDLDEQEKDQEQLFAFVTDCLQAFLPSYLPLIEKRRDMPYSPAEKEWQQIRRGRYVEFNLVHDRGTSFGLSTPGARVESILMSLPLTSRWMYMHEPKAGSREERLLKILKEPREWV